MNVSVGCVAYNEEKDLPELLRALVAQDYPHEKMEIILVDSMSTDKTRALMDAFAQEDHGFSRVVVTENPGKYIPSGCNILLDTYQGDALVRIDGHAIIPENFISQNVRVMQEGHEVVGGLRPTIMAHAKPWQYTLLAVEDSLFGSSIASYRRQPKAGPQNSLFHGMYARKVYDAVGYYNEELLRTEDNDMSYRITQAGFELWFDPRIVSYQKIRPTFRRMMRQKRLNGYWIGRTLFVQPRCISWYHVVPLLFVLAILVTVILAFAGITWPLVVLAVLYGVAALAMSVAGFVTAQQKTVSMIAMPVLFLILHVVYGVGTLHGIVVGLFSPKKRK